MTDVRRLLLPLAFTCTILSACHGSAASHTSVASSLTSTDHVSSDAGLTPLADRYGFVRMDTLVRMHPMAGQLAALDRQIMTLQAQLGTPQSAQDVATLRAEQAALQQQLEAAAAHDQSLLHDHGVDLEKQEHTQIAALIAKEGGNAASAPSTQPSVPNLGALISAQRDDYAKRLQSERQRAIQSLATSMNERDTRIFQTKVDALHQREREDAIKLEQDDSGERVSLEAKASNTKLSDTDKRAIAASLSALDAKEDAQRKSEVAADGIVLAHLHDQLQSDSQKEFNQQVAQIQSSSEAQLRARGLVAEVQAQASMQPMSAPTAPPMNAALAAQIREIHAHFQERFRADTRAGIAAYKATHAQLQARFDTLLRAHGDAQKALVKEIETLQAQRDALSARITSQIQTETVSVAEHDSIDVVMTNVLAQAHAVDLTDDVAHEITRTK